MSKHHYNFMNKGFDFVKAVQRLVGDDFNKVQLQDGVEFIHKEGTRLLKLIDDKNQLIIHFNVPIPDLDRDKPIEVIHHHDNPVSHHEWVYRGTKIDEVYALIEIALSNFDPSKVH